MTTVLGIMASPRKGGNTHMLLKEALSAVADGGALADLVTPAEMDIRPCDGCHACWRGEACKHDDDMARTYARLAEADAFAFGTPVYWYGPTAAMKAFVDRLVYFNGDRHRPKVRGKRAIVIVPHEEDDPHMADPVVEFFRRSLGYLEMELAGVLTVGGVTRRGEARDRPEVLAEARELGARLVEGL